MGKMNAGNWGALIQGGIQGAETEQKMTEQDLRNRYMKDSMVDPAAMANQYDTGNFQKWQQQNGQTPFQSQGMLFDPVRNALQDVYKSAKAKLSSFLPGQGQHAMGPAAQSTVPAPGNAAMSTPQPGQSGSSAAPGLPAASGPMPLPQSDAQVGQPRPFADGGIPGRKATGLVRQRPAKPGNKAPASKAAQTAMHPPMEKAPVDNQEMGAEGGPPRNTDAQPGSQDPMLADGGHFIQGAIKHPGALHEQLGVPKGEKIPKGKLDKAAHAKGKLGQRARFAETLSKFSNGGAVDKPQPFKPAAEPKPQPNSFEKDVNNDGQRNRLGKTIKRFADGGDTAKDKPASGLEPAQTTDEWPGLIPALGNSVKFYAKHVGVPIENAYAGAYQAGNRWLMGNQEPAAAPAPKAAPAAAAAPAPSQGPAAPPPMQGPPAPYDDDPSMVEHGGPRPPGDMVTTAPDGTPITPYSRSGMAAALGGSGGGGGAIPSRGPEQQGPPAPAPAPAAAAPIDFSQLQMDHQDIPNTSTQEWDKMKQGIIGGLLAHRQASSPAAAAMMADDQVSKFQHENFMQYMQQGIALDRAGNKQGAMAALKTAYNYMPTGHGMHFGLDPQTGNIVGVGYDEDHGKPVGAPVMLDQQNLNHLMATYSDPKNFVGETLAMQEQKRKNMETAAQIPYLKEHAGLAHAQANEAQQRGNYYGQRNDTTLEAATIRAASAGGSRLPAQSQKFYASQLKNVLDPRDQAEALGVAEMLEGRAGRSDPQTQGKIASLVGMLYAMPPEQRQQFALENKIPLPSLTQQTPMDPAMAYGQGYGQGYGVPPR
jgi:hypothetical protein